MLLCLFLLVSCLQDRRQVIVAAVAAGGQLQAAVKLPQPNEWHPLLSQAANGPLTDAADGHWLQGNPEGTLSAKGGAAR